MLINTMFLAILLILRVRSDPQWSRIAYKHNVFLLFWSFLGVPAGPGRPPLEGSGFLLSRPRGFICGPPLPPVRARATRLL